MILKHVIVILNIPTFLHCSFEMAESNSQIQCIDYNLAFVLLFNKYGRFTDDLDRTILGARITKSEKMQTQNQVNFLYTPRSPSPNPKEVEDILKTRSASQPRRRPSI